MNKESLLKSFQDIKKEIESLKKNQPLHGLLNKFNSEKKQLEKRIEKTVQAEINKAKKFLNEQKKELNSLQMKVESVIKKKGKTTKKKTTRKAAPKTTKKVAKTTKKATSR